MQPYQFINKKKDPTDLFVYKLRLHFQNFEFNNDDVQRPGWAVWGAVLQTQCSTALCKDRGFRCLLLSGLFVYLRHLSLHVIADHHYGETVRLHQRPERVSDELQWHRISADHHICGQSCPHPPHPALLVRVHLLFWSVRGFLFPGLLFIACR